MNLTCVYALLAHSSIKQKDFSNVYVSTVHFRIENMVAHSFQSSYDKILLEGRLQLGRTVTILQAPG